MNVRPAKSPLVSSRSSYAWKDVKTAILVRNFSRAGGLELYVHKLVEGLLQHGLDITVICENAQTDFRAGKLKIVQVSPYRDEANKVEQINHYYKEFSLALDRLGPFDLVHSHHIDARPINVVTFHNHTVFRIEEVGSSVEAEINKFKLLFRSDYKRRLKADTGLIENADVLIFPSQVCKQDYIKHFRPKNPASLVVAYPGWQLGENTHQCPSNSEDMSLSAVDHTQHDKKNTLLFVGRGYRKKGLDILLQACSLLKLKKYSFRLLVAGLSEKTIDRWRLNYFGLDKCVHYLGFVKNMESLYEQASIIVLPSRVEPFGMAALQGMSYGLVPVVSKVSGVSELLVANKDSLIVDNHLSHRELAEKLATLLDNAELLSELSQHARAKAITIDWQNTVDTTLAAYRKVFQKKYIV